MRHIEVGGTCVSWQRLRAWNTQNDAEVNKTRDPFVDIRLRIVNIRGGFLSPQMTGGLHRPKGTSEVSLIIENPIAHSASISITVLC